MSGPEATKPYDGYIFDLDGTIYLSERLIPGAAATVARLRARGARCVFLSNKPIQTREAYAAKLNRLGIPVDAEDVINSSRVMARHFAQTAPGAGVYVIGEPPLREELRRAGAHFPTDPAAVDYVICALDRTFHYGKLNFAYLAVMHGAKIWATNPDRTCPIDGGEIPDCAGVMAALEAVTGKKVELVVGKPSPLIMAVCAERLGVPLSRCLLVGDRLDTDMVMGRTAGCATALVLTGVTTRVMLAQAEIKPDYVLESVAAL